MKITKKDQTGHDISDNTPSTLNGTKTKNYTNEAATMKMPVNNICKFVILAEKQLKVNQEKFDVESMQNDYPLVEILPHSTIIRNNETRKITFKTTNLEMIQNLMAEYGEPMKGLLLSELDEPITKINPYQKSNPISSELTSENMIKADVNAIVRPTEKPTLVFVIFFLYVFS